MYSVSSSFTWTSALKNAAWKRRLLIGTSDFTGYVTKWPSISKVWDTLNPQTITIELSNENRTFNFLFEDPTKMQNVAQVQLGFTTLDVVQLSGTAQAGAPTTITLPSSASTSTDYYAGMAVRITGGTGTGQEQVVLTSRLNQVKNSKGVGAVIGTPGTLPTYWGEYNATGLSRQVVGTGVENGLAYVDVRYYGTATGGAAWSLLCTSLTEIAAVPGDNFIGSAYLKLAGGSLSNISATYWYTQYLSAAYATIASAAQTVTLGATLSRAQQTLLAPANTAWVRSFINFNTTVGAAIDLTLRIALPQVEYGTVASEPISTVGTAAVGVAVHNAWTTQPDSTSTLQVLSNTGEEFITMFSGTTDGARYQQGGLSLTLIDKFKKLANVKVGDTTSPVSHANSTYLIHSMAWMICTSYGMLNATTDASNPDIDWGSFSSWSSLFLADSVKCSAYLTGQQPLELLRKLSALTQSAIFIENNKIKFARFTQVGSVCGTLNDANVLGTQATLDDRQLVNKSWVSGAYDVTSKTFGVTVYNQNSGSISTYGLRENLVAEQCLWLTDSVSTLNLAQRNITTKGVVKPRYQINATLQALIATLGDAVQFQDTLLQINNSFRIMSETVDMETGRKTINIDQSQYFNAFMLDHSTLDSSDILT